MNGKITYAEVVIGSSGGNYNQLIDQYRLGIAHDIPIMFSMNHIVYSGSAFRSINIPHHVKFIPHNCIR